MDWWWAMERAPVGNQESRDVCATFKYNVKKYLYRTVYRLRNVECWPDVTGYLFLLPAITSIAFEGIGYYGPIVSINIYCFFSEIILLPLFFIDILLNFQYTLYHLLYLVSRLIYLPTQPDCCAVHCLDKCTISYTDR